MSADFPSLATVRTVDNERLDRPDFDAVVALVEQSEQGQMGTLLGWGSGVIAPAAVDTTGVTDSAPQKLKLGAFSYYLAVPGLSDDGAHFRSWKGAVFGFDPGAAGQSLFVTISNEYANAIAGDAYHANVGLYVRPYAVDTDQDARRAYGAGSEQAISTKTRRRILHQFMTSPLDATQNLGWALVAVLDWGSLPASAGAKPTVVWRSLWDNEVVQDQVGDLTEPTLDSFRRGSSNVTKEITALTPNGDGVESPLTGFQSLWVSRGYGIITALAQIRKVLSNHLSSVGDKAWDTFPQSTAGAPWGLRELADAVESAVVVLSGYIKWNGSAYEAPALNSTPSGWTLSAALYGGAVNGCAGPYLRITAAPPAGETYLQTSLVATPVWQTGSPYSTDDAALRAAMGAAVSPTAPYIGYVSQFALVTGDRVQGSVLFTMVLRRA